MNERLQAQDEHCSTLKLDLVVLDGLGFTPLSPNGAQVLFTFCSELYERLALITTTNLKFADWVQVFGGERFSAALQDRLTHHARIVELLGESDRFRQRSQGVFSHGTRFIAYGATGRAGKRKGRKDRSSCPAV